MLEVQGGGRQHYIDLENSYTRCSWHCFLVLIPLMALFLSLYTVPGTVSWGFGTISPFHSSRHALFLFCYVFWHYSPVQCLNQRCISVTRVSMLIWSAFPHVAVSLWCPTPSSMHTSAVSLTSTSPFIEKIICQGLVSYLHIRGSYRFTRGLTPSRDGGFRGNNKLFHCCACCFYTTLLNT